MAADYTSIGASESTVERVKEMKPFSTMSHEEFLLEALDAYENEHGD